MQLLFNQIPPIMAYPSDTYISGIVFSENDKYMPYVLSNYINIAFLNNPDSTWLSFNDNWLLSNDGLITQNRGSIPDFAAKYFRVDIATITKRCIENGYYVYGIVNARYIPISAEYKNKEQICEILIHGFEKGRRFLAYGHDGERYVPFELSFNEYDRSLISFGKLPTYFYYLQFNKKAELGFDLAKVVQKLINYLYPHQTSGTGLIQGAESAKAYTQYILNYDGTIPLDMFPINTLRTHKKLMLARLEYMKQKGYLTGRMPEEYKEICNEMAIIYDLAKESHMESFASKKEIAYRLEHMCDCEIILLLDVLNELKAGGRNDAASV